MGSDWVKIVHDTPDKPEVDQLAVALGIDLDAALGKLVRFWIWFDKTSPDGTAATVTPALIDRLTNCPGFTARLLEIGWLMIRNGGYALPKFDRHNGQAAKQRALTKDRVMRSRNGTSVTSAQQLKQGAICKGDIPPEEFALSGEEKPKKTKNSKFISPTLDEVKKHCAEKSYEFDVEYFWNFYESNGWVQGKAGKPLRNWQLTLANWNKNHLKGLFNGRNGTAARTGTGHTFTGEPLGDV